MFNSFYDNHNIYQEDVASIMDDVILQNGREDFRIGVLTNELHGHLGIYAIIGAKMGLRAREYFDVGLDDLSVISYAGNNPPVSCMNDGLQVSTGATVGHGLITIATDAVMPLPAAEFIFKDQKIRVELKNEITEKIKIEVSTGVKEFGIESEDYWIYIRKLALNYWKDLNRFEIFTITSMNE
jgi:pyrimidine-specific ribonucleoside hydrolase